MVIDTPDMIAAAPTSTVAVIINRLVLALRHEYTGRKDDPVDVVLVVRPEHDVTMSRVAAAFATRGWHVSVQRQSDEHVRVRITSRYDAIDRDTSSIVATDDAIAYVAIAVQLVADHRRGKVVKYRVEHDAHRHMLHAFVCSMLADRSGPGPASRCVIDGDYIVL